MGHEAAMGQNSVQAIICGPPSTDFVMRSSILLGSRMNVGRVTRLRSAPGRSWLMMWDKTVRKALAYRRIIWRGLDRTIALVVVDDGLVFFFPWLVMRGAIAVQRLPTLAVAENHDRGRLIPSR